MPIGLPPIKILERIKVGSDTASVTIPASGTISALTNFPSGSRHVVVIINGQIDEAYTYANLQARFNSDTGNNYHFQQLAGTSATDYAGRTSSGSGGRVGFIHGTDGPDDGFSTAAFMIPHAFGTADHTAYIGWTGTVETAVGIHTGRWANTAAITDILIRSESGGNIVAGTVVELAVIDEDFAVKGAETILTADATVTFSDINDRVGEGDLIAIGFLRSDRAAQDADEIISTINADTTDGNYDRQKLEGTSSSTVAQAANDRELGECPGDGATANAFGAAMFSISAFGKPDNDRHITSITGFHDLTGPDSSVRTYSSRRNNPGSGDTVDTWLFAPNAGTNFKAGSALSLYHAPKRLVGYRELEATASSVTFSDIPQDFHDLRLTIYGRSDGATTSDSVEIEFNGDTTAANYDSQNLLGYGSSVGAGTDAATKRIMLISGANATANVFDGGSVLIPAYAETDRHTGYLGHSGAVDDNLVRLRSNRWENTAAITSVKIQMLTGDFVAGSTFMLEAILPVGGETDQIKPTIETHVDWANAGDFSAAIDDISSDVRWWSSFTGVSVPAQPTWRSVIGKISVRLKNTDGKYNSFNSASPLFGNILPRRRVRIRQTTPVVRSMFVGYLDSITPTGSRRTGRGAVMTALGPGIALNNRVRIPQKTAITTDVAVTAVLDELSWPTADRALETGKTTMTRWWADDVLAINAIRELEATEGGWFRETKSGEFAFENREHRVTGARLISQAEYSDDPSDALHYTDLPQQDPMRSIYNDIRSPVSVFRDDPGGVSVLWTHPEANTDATPVAPEILAGETLTVTAKFPNENAVLSGTGFAVSAWVDPLVATTDYLANSQANGGGTNRTANVTVAITASSESAKITITNDLASDSIFLTKLQARGTALQRLDPVTMSALDQASVDKYDRQTYPRPAEARWVPTTAEAQGWANAQLGIYKDPQPIIGMRIEANASLLALVDASTRRVSDRITVEADGSFLSMGINQDFFIENIRQRYTAGQHLVVEFMLSDAQSRSGFWVLGTAELGADTRLFY